MCDARVMPPIVTHTQIDSISLSMYREDDIKKLSVQKIYNPQVFDSLLYPLPGGPHDYALGPVENNETCVTCGLRAAYCPGHFGHIQLPLIIYNPVLFDLLYKMLKKSCYVCHRFLFKSPLEPLFLEGKLRLADAGFVPEALRLEEAVCGEEMKESDPDDMQDAIDIFISEIIGENVARERCNTRHVKQFRNSIVKSVLSITHNNSSLCKNCNAPMRSLRQDYHTRFSMVPLSGRKVKKYLKAWNQQSSDDDTEHKDEELYLRKNIDENWCTSNVLLTPFEVRNHIKQLWDNESTVINIIFNRYSQENQADIDYNIFFQSIVPVPPTKFRPMAHFNGRSYEGPQTANIKNILLRSAELQKALKDIKEKSDKTAKDFDNFHYAWNSLQNAVNGFIDSDLNTVKSQHIATGIRQLLEHKEGLFRKHMMGKRVDYSARSVISPDLNINVDEIGIPMVFALKLTFPEPVTPWNVKQLRQAIVNGPLKHPGATHIEDADGTRVLLSKSKSQREAMARQLLTPSALGKVEGAKKVHRHLRNGDILLANRQPTLHRPSIMAHKARVLSGENTLRLHYANCKSYNADFDGDEMNVHMPQNEVARSEAINLVGTQHQYLSPKDGAPISGLIQDHVIGGVLLTIRGRMLDVHTYFQLVYAALPTFKHRFRVVPPCMLKPKKLWSGKQVISTVLKNIIPAEKQLVSMHGKAKTGGILWTELPYMSENEVIFRDGELLCGVLDKSQFGSTQFGLVHACHELYGSSIASELLSALARLFTVFLQHHGFSMGVADILLTKEGEKLRNSILKRTEEAGFAAANELFSSENEGVKSVDEESLRKKFEEFYHTGGSGAKKHADLVFKKHANKINNELNQKLNKLHLKGFPENSLHLMVEAGAKGSAVNRLQISALLGQIELEGARPPLTISGRSLPCNKPYDISLRAGGFVTGRFLTGINPREYFFHCMAGREGLIDTAVKTSRSGYLQRCLIKHLEGIKVCYDLTVRDSDGSVIQFLFGEDGICPEKSAYLQAEQFNFIRNNIDAMNSKLDTDKVVEHLRPGLARSYIEKINAKMNKYTRKLNCTNEEFLYSNSLRATPFLNYYSKCRYYFRIDEGQEMTLPLANHRRLWQMAAIDNWYKLTDEEIEKYYRYCETSFDTVQSIYQPDYHIGSLSEKMQSVISNYLTTEFDSFSPDLTAEEFRTCFELKYLSSLCQPGDPVGILAAQSIGEPSTQMTLNTFHFAGRGEMNVTLGIPRLREILMTASANISTPCMEAPLLKGLGMEVAKGIERALKKVTMEEVLEKFEVLDSITSDGHPNSRYRKIRFKLAFHSKKYVKEYFGLSMKRILSYVETKFIRIILTTISRMVKNQHDTLFKVKVDKIIEDNREENENVAEDKDEPDASDEKNKAANGKEGVDLLEDAESSDSGGEVEQEEGKQSAEKQYAAYDDSDEVGLEKSDSDDEEKEIQQKDVTDEMDILEQLEQSERTPNTNQETEFTNDKADRELSKRARKVLGAFSQVKAYTYDQEKYKWCEITFALPISTSFIMIMPVLQNLVKRCIVREASGIKRAFIKEQKGEVFITTEGANIKELWKYNDKLDLNRLYTNDIVLLCNTYGIEAAYKAISKEIISVFKMYGIAIDSRHLSLIADYQTVDGVYRGCNRTSMECNPSPFQQMSFETPMKFLRDSMIGQQTDHMDSPSASIVTGQLVKSGTGSFDIIQRLF